MQTMTINEKSYSEYVLTGRVNYRAARCRRCGGAIGRRAGRGWQFQGKYITNSPIFYLCAGCSAAQEVEERGLREASGAIDEIMKAMRLENAPLGFMDKEVVMRKLRGQGAGMNEAAERAFGAIRELVAMGEAVTVWDVIGILEGQK